MSADFGIIGLGPMGQNLALNVEGKGYCVAVYNRTAARTIEFMQRRAVGRNILPVYSLEEFVKALSRPRRILIQVAAGAPVDDVLEQLFPSLDRGDIVMDGGNSHFTDTDRRVGEADRLGILYLGLGISGGEYGALHGPSIMAGGHKAAYDQVSEILMKIVAKGPEGPCCGYFGPGSAGHYVKMVHNGIEYAIMECIAEAYDLLKRVLGMETSEVAEVFGRWKESELSGYLFEITEKILRFVEPETGKPLVELILDAAEQKGTGKWSTQSALDLGIPASTISASVFARILSGFKSEREKAASILSAPEASLRLDRDSFISDLFWAVYLTCVAAHAQGMQQLSEWAKERGYDLNLAEVARVWMAGCIIRSRLLSPIRRAYLEEPQLPFLFLSEPFRSAWNENHLAFRRVVCSAHEAGIPVPAMDSALDFIDGFRTERLPANLIQAQRDFFGAHGYRRIDRPGLFHTQWEG